MKVKAIVHAAEEGGYWAEIPAIPGCVTQGDTYEELLHNIYEAVEACLSVDVTERELTGEDRVLEIVVRGKSAERSSPESWKEEAGN
jgi:predicted RNase H-like HicB family nuclease